MHRHRVRRFPARGVGAGGIHGVGVLLGAERRNRENAEKRRADRGAD
jgi:hypothetical protein